MFMLVRRSEKKTPYVLPVVVNNYRLYWYYDSEYLLFKAYRQLLKINGKFKPCYPLVFDEVIYV